MRPTSLLIVVGVFLAVADVDSRPNQFHSKRTAARSPFLIRNKYARPSELEASFASRAAFPTEMGLQVRRKRPPLIPPPPEPPLIPPPPEETNNESPAHLQRRETQEVLPAQTVEEILMTVEEVLRKQGLSIKDLLKLYVRQVLLSQRQRSSAPKRRSSSRRNSREGELNALLRSLEQTMSDQEDYGEETEGEPGRFTQSEDSLEVPDASPEFLPEDEDAGSKKADLCLFKICSLRVRKKPLTLRDALGLESREMTLRN